MTHTEEALRPFQVCPECEGHGTRANPVFDGMSLSLDTFDGNELDYQDFTENYFGGNYDVICPECQGKRVTRVECECEECEEERQAEWDDLAERRYFDRMGL